MHEGTQPYVRSHREWVHPGMQVTRRTAPRFEEVATLDLGLAALFDQAPSSLHLRQPILQRQIAKERVIHTIPSGHAATVDAIPRPCQQHPRLARAPIAWSNGGYRE